MDYTNVEELMGKLGVKNEKSKAVLIRIFFLCTGP